MKPARLIRSAIVLRPSTLLNFHHALRDRKYRALFSQQRKRKPGPQGPSKELIDAIADTKRRNPTWGCPRIAQQIALAFGIPLDKDVVRRVLATHYKPDSDSCGPSWLSFLGHVKDSLWSLDLFCCESVTLRTHWVSIARIPSALKILTLASPASRLLNHDCGTVFVVFLFTIRV